MQRRREFRKRIDRELRELLLREAPGKQHHEGAETDAERLPGPRAGVIARRSGVFDPVWDDGDTLDRDPIAPGDFLALAFVKRDDGAGALAHHGIGNPLGNRVFRPRMMFRIYHMRNAGGERCQAAKVLAGVHVPVHDIGS